MGKFRDMAGQTVGRWKVLYRTDPPNGGRGTFWMCECQCKKKTRREVEAGNLQTALKGTGGSTSCGCYRTEYLKSRKTHGDATSPSCGRRYKTYKSWQDMKARCLNPNNTQYDDYGGRGITICKKWINSYEAFKADMGLRPLRKSLDRKNVNGNYHKRNCKWETKKKQARNKQDTVYYTHKGVRRPLVEWAEMYGVRRSVLFVRLFRMKPRMKFLKAVQTPVAGRKVLYPHKGQMLTRKQIAVMEGVPIRAFSQRMHDYGNDSLKALEKPFKPGAK